MVHDDLANYRGHSGGIQNRRGREEWNLAGGNALSGWYWNIKGEPVRIPKTPSESENTGVPTIREIIVATTMSSLFVAFFALIAATFRTRAALQAEILALRHQLAAFQKNRPCRLRLHRFDRLLWVVLYRCWAKLATMSRDGSARHGSPLAPPSFRLALDQKIAPPSRQARSCGQHS